MTEIFIGTMFFLMFVGLGLVITSLARRAQPTEQERIAAIVRQADRQLYHLVNKGFEKMLDEARRSIVESSDV